MAFVKLMLAVSTLLPVPLGAQSIKWEQIWDQPDVAIIYVDRASAAGPKDLRSIATRTVYKGALPQGYIAERIRIEEFDCVRFRSRLRKVTIVANDGRPPQVLNWPPGESEWQAGEPDTPGARKSEIACA